MPKPIALLYLPDNYYDGSPNLPYKIMHTFNGDDPRAETNPAFQDYLWLCFTKYNIDAPELQVFYPKDFTDLQFEELKDMVQKHFDENFNKPS